MSPNVGAAGVYPPPLSSSQDLPKKPNGRVPNETLNIIKIVGAAVCFVGACCFFASVGLINPVAAILIGCLFAATAIGLLATLEIPYNGSPPANPPPGAPTPMRPVPMVYTASTGGSPPPAPVSVVFTSNTVRPNPSLRNPPAPIRTPQQHAVAVVSQTPYGPAVAAVRVPADASLGGSFVNVPLNESFVTVGQSRHAQGGGGHPADRRVIATMPSATSPGMEARVNMSPRDRSFAVEVPSATSPGMVARVAVVPEHEPVGGRRGPT